MREFLEGLETAPQRRVPHPPRGVREFLEGLETETFALNPTAERAVREFLEGLETRLTYSGTIHQVGGARVPRRA